MIALGGYVGLPWRTGGRNRDGCDCWGLVCLVYRDLLGIALTDYGAQTRAAEAAEVAAMIHGSGGCWLPTSGPATLDLVLLRGMGGTLHCGLFVEGGRLLHADAGRLSGIEPLGHGRWAKRVRGFYLHADRVPL